MMNSEKQTNIFIVDDNKVFALALKAYIENAFNNMLVKIYLFVTGEKCMESFMQVIPELVILDYDLNGKSEYAENGVQFLEKIKKANASTSVIMLTSNDRIETALESFHRGASDYVVKTDSPFKKISASMAKIFSQRNIEFESLKNKKRALEILIANKELSFQIVENEKRAAELIISSRELSFQNEEKEKRAAEFTVVNNQKAEMERSKLLVEEKNRDITDSINYAKLIQQAKLPKKETIYASLPGCFVLFHPKDIVSGDFYFFHKKNNFIFIGVADCTGHGVPGAFMSMIGSEKLTEAIAHTSDTSEILKYLNKGIKNSLQQSDSAGSSRDGMDIAMCRIDMENGTVKYAGANRPLWVIRKGNSTVEEIKGTKTAIAGFTGDDQDFQSHEVKLVAGDTFYLTTDGYADQFGGQKGKKIMTRKLKEILIDIQVKPMPDQMNYLENFMENWKTGQEQVDDILIIGVRF
jgi:serine phosphatase RsbU (regulator of sigma subunit)